MSHNENDRRMVGCVMPHEFFADRNHKTATCRHCGGVLTAAEARAYTSGIERTKDDPDLAERRAQAEATRLAKQRMA